MLNKLLIVLIFCLTFFQAFAQNDITVNITAGAEWEFSHPDFSAVNEETLNTGNEKKHILKIIDYYRKICPANNCRIFHAPNKRAEESQVVVKPNTSFVLSYDPSVIEVQPHYGDENYWNQNKDVYQYMIFDQLQSQGYSAKSKNLAGHFNIGFKSLTGGDLNRFAQFYFDFMNHQELTFGALGRDRNNAPHPIEYGNEFKKILKAIQIEVNTGKIKTVHEFQQAIHERLYTKSNFPKETATFHYQAFNIQNLRDYQSWEVDHDEPIEIRSVQGQQNVAQFILLIQFFNARANYLIRNRVPIWYNENQNLNLIDNKFEIVTRFYISVKDAGLDWEKLKFLMPENLLVISPNKFILNSDDWSNGSLDKLKNLIDLVHNSVFFRNKLIELFNNAQFVNSGNAVKIAHILRAEISRIENEVTTLSMKTENNKNETKIKEPFYKKILKKVWKFSSANNDTSKHDFSHLNDLKQHLHELEIFAAKLAETETLNKANLSKTVREILKVKSIRSCEKLF